MIGIVGNGFVGNAVAEGFKHAFEPVIYDKFKGGTVNSIEDLVRAAKRLIFVCVPTPMLADGVCDASIVEEVVRDIASVRDKVLTPVVVIKSTVPPGTCERLSREYKSNIVFNPEFLYERSAVDDFRNQTRVILGGRDRFPEDLDLVAGYYSHALPGVPVVRTDFATAEMVKYVTNVFLATKVALANEFSQICEKLAVDYAAMSKIAQLDDRLGKTHWQVPGPDGHAGFGGKCLCKDLNGLMALARALGVDAKVMRGVWGKNLEVRPGRDWEDIAGVVSN